MRSSILGSITSRPLTMLETGLKLLTTCINNRLHDSLKRSPIFSPAQAAFLPDTNITDLTRTVEAAQKTARENGEELHMGFLDLKQAFERVEPWASDAALKRLGVPENICNLMANLDDTATRTVTTIDGQTPIFDLECGIPQGEVLSPFRFNALMDMLATWLTLRCEGHNPDGAEMGYAFRTATDAQRNRLQQWIPRLDSFSTTTIRRVHSLFYCDDICIMAKSQKDLQDMVAVISEFMQIMGIQLNTQKSYYTRWDPTDNPATSTKIYTQGTWDGGLDGSWSADTKGPTLTYKTSDQACRYLGIHFAMDGNWDTQLDILETRLADCLIALHNKDLSVKLLRYIMNVVFIPKLTNALAIPGIHWAKRTEGKHGHEFVAKLDTDLRAFVYDYLKMAKSTTTHMCHSPPTIGGLGIYSLADRTHTEIITATHTALNDWTLSHQWNLKGPGPSVVTPTGKTLDLHRLYRDSANIWPIILTGTLDHYAEMNNILSFPLSSACSRPKRGGNPAIPIRNLPATALPPPPDWKPQSRKNTSPVITDQLAHFVHARGYSIDSQCYNDTANAQQDSAYRITFEARDPRHPERYITQTIDDNNDTPGAGRVPLVSAMHRFMLVNDVHFMRNLLEPCGMRLLTWDDFLTRQAGFLEHPNPESYRETTPFPTWWNALEQRLLMTEPALLESRIVQSRYREIPYIPSLEEIPHHGRCRYLAFTTPDQNDGRTVQIATPQAPGTHFLPTDDGTPSFVYTFNLPDMTDAAPQTPAEPRREATIHAHLHQYRTPDNAAQEVMYVYAPNPGQGPNAQAQISYDATTLKEIMEHTHDHTRLYFATRYGCEHQAESEDEEVDETHAEHDVYTDGSFFPGRDLNLLGASAVFLTPKDHEGKRYVKKIQFQVDHNPHPCTTTTGYLSHNPGPITSFKAELASIAKGRTHGSRFEPMTGRISIANDNMAVINTLTGDPPATNTNQRLRTNEVEEIDLIRRTRGFPRCKFTHVYGHNNTKYNDAADTQARRGTFLPAARVPSRFPPETDTKFHLFFNENPVTGDPRRHINAVHSEHHSLGWESMPSQGALMRLARDRDQQISLAKTTSRSRWSEKFYARLLSWTLSTPASLYTSNKLNSPGCPFCPAPTADIHHVLLECKHPTMVAQREALSAAMLDILTNPEPSARLAPDMTPRACTPHPATTITARQMYPLSPKLWSMRSPIRLLLEALPENRLYSKSSKNCITVRPPSPHNGPQETKVLQDADFWRRIAEHQLTEAPSPLERKQYDQRALDILNQPPAAAETQAPQNPGRPPPESEPTNSQTEPHPDNYHILLRFWEPHGPPPPLYPGGESDSLTTNNNTPCADVINSHPLLILAGQLPPSFPKFLEWLAHPPKTTAAVKRSLLYTLSRHLKRTYLAYAYLLKAHRHTLLDDSPLTQKVRKAAAALLVLSRGEIRDPFLPPSCSPFSCATNLALYSREAFAKSTTPTQPPLGPATPPAINPDPTTVKLTPAAQIAADSTTTARGTDPEEERMLQMALCATTSVTPHAATRSEPPVPSSSIRTPIFPSPPSLNAPCTLPASCLCFSPLPKSLPPPNNSS